MNMKTGITIVFKFQLRWNCCNKEDEKEIRQVGCMYKLKRDSIFDEITASKHSSTIWGYIRKECTALRFWIPRYERVSIDEGKKEAIFWTLNKKYPVSDSTRISIHAQK
jgi:hypothetical protein